MKTTSVLPRIVLLTLALGAASVATTFAQTTPATTTPPTCTSGHKPHGGADLTDAEKTQLKTAHDAALAANNGALQTEQDNLKQQREALKAQANPTEDDKKAQREAGKAFEEKLHAAMLAIDPTLAPIFAKLEAAHQGHHHNAGA